MAATRRKTSQKVETPEKEALVRETPPQASDTSYIKIPVPSLNGLKALNMSGTNPLLLVLLVGISFLAGVLYMKVQNLENGSGSTTVTTPTNAFDTFVGYAKSAKLNTKKFTACLEQNKYDSNVQKDTSDGNLVGVTGTPATYINGIQVVGAQPFTAFKTIIDQELAKASIEESSTYASLLHLLIPQAQAQTTIPVGEQTIPSAGEIIPTPTPAVYSNVGLGTLPLLGDKNAKVTVIEFSDFQCPFCKRFVDDAYTQIKKEYVDTGKVKLAFRHYPLSFHANANMAANASECANEQGKFWQMHDMLFANQDAWANLPKQAVPSTTTQ